MNQEFNNGCGEYLFMKLYGIVRGNYGVKKIGLSSSIDETFVKNECTDKYGICYDLYQETNRLKGSLEKLESGFERISDESKVKQLTSLYEQVLVIMCKKMFFCGILMTERIGANNITPKQCNKNNPYELMGDRIKKNRESLGYTQQQVAEALNVSRCTYDSYEKNKAEPELSKIIKLSEIFNVSYRCLLDDEDTGMFLD